jgi:hypothetical protein
MTHARVNGGILPQHLGIDESKVVVDGDVSFGVCRASIDKKISRDFCSRGVTLTEKICTHTILSDHVANNANST